MGWFRYPRRFNVLQGGRHRRRWRLRGGDFLAVACLLALLGVAVAGAGGFQGPSPSPQFGPQFPSTPFEDAPAPAEPRRRSDVGGIRLRVIDGDTVEIRGVGERVRLANIDTAETGDRARCAAERAYAARARDEARRLVAAAQVIEVRRTGRVDRYGRTVGFVVLDGRDLGRTMMDEGLARPWRGRRQPWCAADGSLLP